MSTRITGFAFDDENEDKMAEHGVSARRALQVLENAHIIVRNRQQRRGLMLVIGLDHSGGCIALPVEPTRDLGIWRPITAWPCKPHERARLD